MRRIVFPAALLALVLTACTNANPKKMAEELCDCVKSKKQVSAEAKKIILDAAKSTDFQETLQEGIAAIEDESVKEKVQDDIQTIALSFQGPGTKECAEAVDKKHRVSKADEKDMQKKLVDEMEKVDDCEVYAAFIKVGLKQQASASNSNSGSDASGTTDEADTKKKTGSDEQE